MSNTANIKDGNAALQNVAVSGAGTSGNPYMPIVNVGDPSTGNATAVQKFHNSDNTTLSASAYGLLTGGVAQIINPTGTLDRQRGTGFDAIPATGVASGSQQLAVPFNTTCSSPVSAGTVTVTPAAMSGTINGLSWTIQIGMPLSIDTGAAQEVVIVTARTNSTFTAVFANAHSGTWAISGFVYNQARDGGACGDVTNGIGFSPSATFIYNAITGNYERTRSAAGENDGASGIGTSVAAAYGYNGVTYDRMRTLQGKGFNQVGISSGGANGSSSIILASAPTGLAANERIRLYNGTSFEDNIVAASYVSGTTVPLVNAIANGTHTQFQYEVFTVNGPGTNGFLPVGLGIEEEALYSPTQNLYYVERSADQDGMQPYNLAAMSPGVWNGSTMDRLPGDKTNGAYVNLKQLPGSTPARSLSLDTTGTNLKASAGQIMGWSFYNNASSIRYVKIFDKATTAVVGTDTPIMTIPVPPNSAVRDNFTSGVTFNNGLSWAATRNPADSDTAAPTANDIIANLMYR